MTSHRHKVGILSWGGKRVPLGTITSFEEVLNKQVMTTPLPSRSSEWSIAIDTGGKTTIEVQFAHKNGDDGMHNSIWADMLAKAIDRWQVKTDGVNLHIIIDEDDPQAVDDRFQWLGSESDNTTQDYHGYISNLTINQPAGVTDILTGSLTLVLGSRTITNGGGNSFRAKSVSYALPQAMVSTSSALISFDKGETYDILTGWFDGEDDDGGMDSVLKGYTVTGGYMEPFEKLEMKLSYKQFTARFPNKYSDAGSEPLPYFTRIRISGIGTGEYIITEINQNNTYITMTGYSLAMGAMRSDSSELMAEERNSGAEPIDTYIRRQISRIQMDGKQLYQPDTTHVDCFTDWGSYIRVPKGKTIWEALRMVAQMVGARVFFSQGHAQFVDYTRLVYKTTEGEEVFGTAITAIAGQSLTDQSITQSGTYSATTNGDFSPLDMYGQLGDRICGEVTYESGESNMINTIQVFAKSSQGSTLGGNSGITRSSHTSVAKQGVKPGGMWDVRDWFVSESENENNPKVLGVADTFLLTHHEPFKEVHMTLKDVAYTEDGGRWEPLFPPCCTVLGLNIPQDSVYIKIGRL